MVKIAVSQKNIVETAPIIFGWLEAKSSTGIRETFRKLLQSHLESESCNQKPCNQDGSPNTERMVGLRKHRPVTYVCEQ